MPPKKKLRSTTTRITFSWTIRNFLAKLELLEFDEYINSGDFTASSSFIPFSSTATFRLQSCKVLDGPNQYLTMFLSKISRSCVSVDYHVYVEKADGTAWRKLRCTDKLNERYQTRGFEKAFSVQDIEADQQNLLPDGNLTIGLDLLVIFPGEPSNTLDAGSAIPHDGSTQDIVQATKSLLQDPEFSDVVLKCGGKSFRCHKAILAARSNVFRAMFKKEGLAESQTNEVDIEDMDPDILEAMIKSIYTDSCDTTSDDDQRSCELMKAADKYQLMGLKSSCESKLIKNLSSSNASDVLSWALAVDAKSLKIAARNFVLDHLREISPTKSFAELVKEFPEALREV